MGVISEKLVGNIITEKQLSVKLKTFIAQDYLEWIICLSPH